MAPRKSAEKRQLEDVEVLEAAPRRRLGAKQAAEVAPAAVAAPEGKAPKVALDRGAVSGMLTQLKYAASEASNKKGTFLIESQQALAAYRALSDGQKPAFLKDYQEGRVKGSMIWVNGYSEKVENVASTSSSEGNNMLNRNQILKLNGFEPHTLKEDKMSVLLEGLLVEAETKFGYVRATEPHAIPELARYLYKWDNGSVRAQTRNEIDSLETKGDVVGKALQDMISSASGSSKCVVKFEHPEYQKLKGALPALRSGKKVLENKVSEMDDIMAAAYGAENMEKTAWKEADMAKAVLKRFVDDLRYMIPKLEKIAPADVTENDVLDAEKVKLLASTHLDGIKEKIRKLKAVL
jgi:hypothetical protein